MSEPTTVASNAAEPVGTIGSTPSFSYCCECGTYDAHASVCNCCGFDFSGEAAVVRDDT